MFSQSYSASHDRSGGITPEELSREGLADRCRRLSPFNGRMCELMYSKGDGSAEDRLTSIVIRQGFISGRTRPLAELRLAASGTPRVSLFSPPSRAEIERLLGAQSPTSEDLLRFLLVRTSQLSPEKIRDIVTLFPPADPLTLTESDHRYATETETTFSSRSLTFQEICAGVKTVSFTIAGGISPTNRNNRHYVASVYLVSSGPNRTEGVLSLSRRSDLYPKLYTIESILDIPTLQGEIRNCFASHGARAPAVMEYFDDSRCRAYPSSRTKVRRSSRFTTWESLATRVDTVSQAGTNKLLARLREELPLPNSEPTLSPTPEGAGGRPRDSCRKFHIPDSFQRTNLISGAELFYGNVYDGSLLGFQGRGGCALVYSPLGAPGKLVPSKDPRLLNTLKSGNEDEVTGGLFSILTRQQVRVEVRSEGEFRPEPNNLLDQTRIVMGKPNDSRRPILWRLTDIMMGRQSISLRPASRAHPRGIGEVRFALHEHGKSYAELESLDGEIRFRLPVHAGSISELHPFIEGIFSGDTERDFIGTLGALLNYEGFGWRDVNVFDRHKDLLAALAGESSLRSFLSVSNGNQLTFALSGEGSLEFSLARKDGIKGAGAERVLFSTYLDGSPLRLCYAVTESAIETPVSPLNKVLGTLLQSMNIRTTRSKLFLAEHGPVMSPADVKVLIDCLLFEAMQSEDAAKRSSLQPSPLLRVLSSRFGPNAMERIPQGRMGNLFLI